MSPPLYHVRHSVRWISSKTKRSTAHYVDNKTLRTRCGAEASAWPEGDGYGRVCEKCQSLLARHGDGR